MAEQQQVVLKRAHVGELFNQCNNYWNKEYLEWC